MRGLRRFFSKETLLAVGAIALAAVIIHAVRLGQLGFYYDDWYVLWSGAARGARSMVGLFYTDRRAMGHLYEVTYRLLGDWMLGWHLYALAWRLVCALAFFWILRSLWPERKQLSTLAALLLVAYPAFLSQPDALTKVNHLTGYGLALASMALMLAALRVKDKRISYVFEIAGLAAGSAYVWIYEYMIGLEGMRLALLVLLLYKLGVRGFWPMVKAVIRRYGLYVVPLAGFLYWRLFIFTSVRPTTNVEGLVGSYQSNPLFMGLRVVVQTALDFLSVTVFAWFVKLYQYLSRADFAQIGLALLLAAAGIAIAVFYKRLSGRADESVVEGGDDRRAASEMALVGLAATLCAILPVVVSNRSIDLTDAYKSYGLHPAAGAILLVLGGLLLLQPKARYAILLGLFGLSLAVNSLNLDYWKTLWQVQREMWWQVTWRAPDLADDTFVMAYAPDGYLYQQDYEVWSPLNLIYRPGQAEAPAIQSEVLNSETLLDVVNRSQVETYVRDIPMNRSYGNLLLLSQPTLASCVHVIDGKLPVYSGSERLLVRAAGEYSNLSRIQTEGEAPTPPKAIFGGEPEHGWCYFYQKAELARQKGDWQGVLDLYQQAQSAGLRAADRSEYFPFVEALVNRGQTAQARQLFAQNIAVDPLLAKSLCSSLSKNPDYPSEYGYDYGGIHAVVCGK